MNRAVVTGKLTRVAEAGEGRKKWARGLIETPTGMIPVRFLGTSAVDRAKALLGSMVLIIGQLDSFYLERSGTWSLSVVVRDANDIWMLTLATLAEDQKQNTAKEVTADDAPPF